MSAIVLSIEWEVLMAWVYLTEGLERRKDELIEPAEVDIIILEELVPAFQSSGGKDAEQEENRDCTLEWCASFQL